MTLWTRFYSLTSGIQMPATMWPPTWQWISKSVTRNPSPSSLPWIKIKCTMSKSYYSIFKCVGYAKFGVSWKGSTIFLIEKKLKLYLRHKIYSYFQTDYWGLTIEAIQSNLTTQLPSYVCSDLQEWQCLHLPSPNQPLVRADACEQTRTRQAHSPPPQVVSHPEPRHYWWPPAPHFCMWILLILKENQIIVFIFKSKMRECRIYSK